MKSKLGKLISTVCGLGYIPWAPGTFGSIPGLILALLTHHLLYDRLGETNFFIVSTFIGVLICIKAYIGIRWTEKKWPHDDKRIVIDELAGQYFTSVYFPVTWIYALMGFALFRFFDILKPPPVRFLEKAPGGIGIVLDDIGAGLYSNLVLQLILFYA